LWYFEPMAIDKNAVTKNAQKYVAKGQYDKALAEWNKLLKESPNDPNIYNTIGDLCLKKNAKPDAVNAYKRAADLLAEDGFTSKAIALYKKVLNIDITKIEVHLALGDMNAEKGLTGNAIENYKHAADHYIQNKETAKALDTYQKMADLNPSNITFQIKLGDMYAKEGMKEKSTGAYLVAADEHMAKSAFQDARQLFEKVLAQDPDNKEVYHKAGIVYFKEGKFVEACKAFKPAFENDPTNTELVDIYLEALEKVDNTVEAEQVIHKLLEAAPDSAEFRERLYNLHLAKKDFEKAIVEAGTIADGKIESGNADEAEELYKAFVDGCPDYAPGRQKLAEFYIFVNRPQEAAPELLQAADLFIDEGDLQNARAVLTQAIEIAPELTEAKERLEKLPAPGTEAPPPEREFTSEEEPVPDTTPPVVPEPVPPRVRKAAAPPVEAKPVVEKEDPAINEAFAEADVLVKYGLAVKAIEQLEALTSKYPENTLIRTRLGDLYFEQGDSDKAVKHALLAVALHTKNGREDQASALLQTTRERAPDHPAVLSRLGEAPVVPKPEEPMLTAPEEVDLIIEPLDTPLTPTKISPPSREETGKLQEPAPAGEIEFEELDIGIPHLEESMPGESVPVAELPESELQPVEKDQADVVEQEVIEPAAKAATEEQPAEVDIDEIWAEAEFYFQQGLFDAAKKHYAQIITLTPGDRRAIDRLTELSREEDETREYSKLTDAVEELEGSLPSSEATEGELAASTSDQNAVRSLMQEIQQIREQPAAPPAEEKVAVPPHRVEAETVRKPRKPAKKSAEEDFSDLGQELRSEAKAGSKPRKPAKKSTEEDFFDLGQELRMDSASEGEPASAVVQHEEKPSEEFFDLAAELRDELSNVPAPEQPAVSEEDQSLDEIFEEFKKGIELQSTKEEADTHYNLGVAYKEMGLLDDAIGELIHTQQNEPKFIQSRYMLGLCYMEKGEYQNAIGEIQNALDSSENLEVSAENRIAMRYDLGLAYQGAGNNDKAIGEFQKVADEQKHYRDTDEKLKELNKGDFISFEQLRDDIEKEISAKFLEEGERIEREEKTKKTDRMKNEIA
jgi:pilus assembly protein FimV